MLHEVVIRAVEDALSSKGYLKSAQGGPTFLVSQQAWLSRRYKGATQDPYFSGSGATFTSFDLEPRGTENIHEQAKVIVEFRTAQNCPAFWRGMATVNLDPCATAGERAEAVRKAVMKAIGKFPRQGQR